MDLIDTDRAVQLYQALGSAVEMSGGSAANTMCGVASFGGTRRLPRQGERRRSRPGVRPRPPRRRRAVPAGRPPQRGADRPLHHRRHARRRAHDEHLPRRVEPAVRSPTSTTTAIAGGRVLYMEGYLYDRPEAKEAFRHAAGIAHDRRPDGVAHAVRLVLRRPPPRRLPVARGRRGRPAVRQRGRADGALPDRLVRRRDRRRCASTARSRPSRSAPRVRSSSPSDELIDVPAVPVRQVIDTTGAGDLYAAGFLYGLTTGRPLAECGQLGSIAAAEVISPRRPPAPGRAADPRLTRIAYAGAMTDATVRERAQRWLAAEPDDDIRDELQALIDGPADELVGPLRRPPAVRHGRPACRRRRRAAADEPARRAAGGGRARAVPPRHRSASTRARRRHRLRRPPQERRVRRRHGAGDGGGRHPGDAVRPAGARRRCWRGRSPSSTPPPAWW